jgi:hypothetical protein
MDTYKVSSVLNATSKFTKHHGNNHIPWSLLIFEMTTFDLLHPVEMLPTSLKICSNTRRNVGICNYPISDYMRLCVICNYLPTFQIWGGFQPILGLMCNYCLLHPPM